MLFSPADTVLELELRETSLELCSLQPTYILSKQSPSQASQARF